MQLAPWYMEEMVIMNHDEPDVLLPIREVSVYFTHRRNPPGYENKNLKSDYYCWKYELLKFNRRARNRERDNCKWGDGIADSVVPCQLDTRPAQLSTSTLTPTSFTHGEQWVQLISIDVVSWIPIAKYALTLYLITLTKDLTAIQQQRWTPPLVGVPSYTANPRLLTDVEFQFL